MSDNIEEPREKRRREIREQMEIESHIFDRILEERDRQRRKWGIQDHEDLKWWAIFIEEGLESLSKAVNNYIFSPEGRSKIDSGAKLHEEIYHCLGVGVAWLESRMKRARRET